MINITNDHTQFLKDKEKLIEIFEKSILAVLNDMGEDVKGISWFSVDADKYTSKQYDIAS